MSQINKHISFICFTHPNAAMFSEFWDSVNYLKENSCEFGKWKECKRYPIEETEKYYDSIKRFIKHIKSDGRFNITSFSELKNELLNKPNRVINNKTYLL